MAGKLSCYDDFDETWQRRKTAYSEQIRQSDPADVLRVQPAY